MKKKIEILYSRKIKGKIFRLRIGISLLEIALAIAVTATLSISILGLVSSAFESQSRIEKMELAANLAKAKMTQILSMPVLDPTDKEGTIDTELYKNFKYHIIIKEEQMDLAKLSQTGSLESAKVQLDDQIPTSIQNFKTKEKKGQNLTETGGLIPIYKIRIIITFSLKDRAGRYEVEAFKSAKKI
ncbi:MAG: hypothetical protein ACK4UJ_01390 [Leptonema sp. (in: bacteria)]